MHFALLHNKLLKKTKMDQGFTFHIDTKYYRFEQYNEFYPYKKAQ